MSLVCCNLCSKCCAVLPQLRHRCYPVLYCSLCSIACLHCLFDFPLGAHGRCFGVILVELHGLVCAPALMLCVYDWQQPLLQVWLAPHPHCFHVGVLCMCDCVDGVDMGGLFIWIRLGCGCMHMLLKGITAFMSICMHVAHHTQPYT